MGVIMKNGVKYLGALKNFIKSDIQPTSPDVDFWCDTSTDAVAEAKDIKYDNSISGLTSITSQAAIDEIMAKFKTIVTSGFTYYSSTYNAGGYLKIGKLVIVQIRLTMTAAITAAGNNPQSLLNGLPAPLTSTSLTVADNNTGATGGYVDVTGKVFTQANLTNGGVAVINGYYISAS